MRETDAEKEAADVADVAIRPPSLFLGGLAAAAILELVWPVGPGLAQGSWRPITIGVIFAAFGLFLARKAVVAFNEAGTAYQIHQPTDALVASGVFALTRNPIYIGLIAVYFGAALALTSGWALILLPVLVTVLQKGVVLREEAFMSRKFGADYLAYKAKVPRWL